jgi:hypothetical protein
MPRVIAGKARATVRVSLAAAVASVCAGSALASPASGSTVTIGPPDPGGDEGAIGCHLEGACRKTLAQLAQATPGVLLTAPRDGIIVGWRVHADTLGSTSAVALRVLHPDPSGAFTGVATSSPGPASSLDGEPSRAVTIPVQAGDYIGVDTIAGDGVSSARVYATTPGGTTVGTWSGGLPDNSTLFPSSSTPNLRLQLNAQEALRPAVTGVSPASGSTAGGQAVTISGSDLDGAVGVSFGTTASTSFTASTNQITATAPAGPPGPVDIQVDGPGGVSPTTNADRYTYVGSGGGTAGGPPSNAFTFAGAKSLKNGVVQLTVSVPGAGAIGARDAGATVTTSRTKPKRRKPRFGSVTRHPAAAGNVKMTLKPTAAGRKLLARSGRFSAPVRVTFTPAGGIGARQTTTVVFRKRKAK